MAPKSKKIPSRKDLTAARNKTVLSQHGVWTLSLIAQYGDVIPDVLQTKGRRNKPEKWAMDLVHIEDATYELLDKGFIARPEWLNIFTVRFFVTQSGVDWLKKHNLLPKKVVRKPVLTKTEARVRPW